MTYYKRDLKKSVSRTARIFTFDFQDLPTESSVAELAAGLKHWPDYVGSEFAGTTLSITLKDVPNKLGRPWDDNELAARLTDLAVKLLQKQGDTKEV